MAVIALVSAITMGLASGGGALHHHGCSGWPLQAAPEDASPKLSNEPLRPSALLSFAAMLSDAAIPQTASAALATKFSKGEEDTNSDTDPAGKQHAHPASTVLAPVGDDCSSAGAQQLRVDARPHAQGQKRADEAQRPQAHTCVHHQPCGGIGKEQGRGGREAREEHKHVQGTGGQEVAARAVACRVLAADAGSPEAHVRLPRPPRTRQAR
eukprot:CAMPEP_0179123450 /NCGR_PEP_ID=MMETSP0796-20121207/58302_1 /TAXON_ID=73915 /ORGANISM="Pyrodinium bahamense, Strain pbaha01" /LENGTH=210 /DNA_ID=CAMNT_0020822093 /DNA_START=34 /DNA_END=664 /DNA_ORIENTATION=-